jgi:hypothetical protein
VVRGPGGPLTELAGEVGPLKPRVVVPPTTEVAAVVGPAAAIVGPAAADVGPAAAVETPGIADVVVAGEQYPWTSANPA